MSSLIQKARRAREWDRPHSTVEGQIVRLNPRHGARIHLGCGDVYLAGYLNIDLPPAEGVASGTSAPDVIADITRLDCPHDVLAEIRLHHVFEHFERPYALALLIRWHAWLAPGGMLLVETPDFEGCVKGFSARSFEEQSLVLRHLFGSQEAIWANHLDGWSARRFQRVLSDIGFERVQTDATYSDEDQMLANVVARASKSHHPPPEKEQVAAAKALLELSMNGRNPTEERLAAGWKQDLESALERRG